MNIGGFQKFSMIDYPGKLTAIIFTSACNFRCGYCHNPELVLPEKFNPSLDENEILKFLKTRIGKLDAVSITGGEPTLQKDLLEFIKKVKDLGFLVKLDTNGTNPDMLKKLLDKKLLDFIAMDIKAPLDKYSDIVKVSVDLDKIKESIKLIMNSDLEYEFRTTIVRSQLSRADILEMANTIKGAKSYVLQKFISSKANDESFLQKSTYSDQEFLEIKKEIAPLFENCTLR